MNKKFLSTALFATILGITSNMAYAQIPPPPEGFERPNGHPHMLMPENVRQQKIVEFEKRLNLTEDQKKAIEKNRLDSKKKLDAIRKKEMKLREEKRKILEQNKKYFESILTPAQKEELSKLEAEKRAEMEKMRKERKDAQKKRMEKQIKK